MPRGERNEKVFSLIGAEIRNARVKAGKSQEALAAEVGLDRSSVVLIESGKQRLPIDRLYSIARVLGTTPQKLIPDIKEIFEDSKVNEPTIVFHGGSEEDKEEVEKEILQFLRKPDGAKGNQ
jgi:transcriptional regulator with XRE-family HTH domain